MSHNISISCLVPCYNSINFIDRFIKSYNDQTEPFDELIFFDDCSADGTANYLEEKGYKVIRGDKNRGPSFGRNRLIENSTCSWIHFHDADDVLDISFIKVLKPLLRNNTSNIIFNCGLKDVKGCYLGNFKSYNFENNNNFVNYFLENIGLSIIGLYNKQYLIQNNIYFSENLRFNEDPDFHVRLANSGASFVSVNQELVYIIGHDKSTSKINWWNCVSNKIFCLRHYIQILPHTYHSILAEQLANTAYYSLRSGKISIGYRAMYVLKNEFKQKFRFSNNFINCLSFIVGRFSFLKFVLLIESIRCQK
jgi:glycosyltransferase involved in cell wall biosynthesis